MGQGEFHKVCNLQSEGAEILLLDHDIQLWKIEKVLKTELLLYGDGFWQ
jgi:hypothetical protein